MDIQFTPFILLYFLSGGVTVYLAFRSWQKRRIRGAKYWALVMLFASIYVIGSGLEVLFVSPFWKLVMLRFIYLGVTGFSVGWLLFSLDYSQHEAWITRRTIGLISVMPVTVFMLVLFINAHPLIYQEYELIEQNGLILSNIPSYGIFFYVWAVYGYSMIILGAFWVIQFVWHSQDLFRAQGIFVIISVLIPIVFSVPSIVGLNPIAPLDPTPFTLTVTGIMMAIGSSRFRFLSLIPIGYDVVFNHIDSGVIILDVNGHIVSVNQRAEAIFGFAQDDMIGDHIQDILPEYGVITHGYDLQSRIKSEFLVKGTQYEIQITPLGNTDEPIRGHVIMFHDLSDRIKMQQQAVNLAIQQNRTILLKQFISDVSHDINTPLSIIKTNNYLIRRQFGEAISKRVDVIDIQADRLGNLFQAMVLMVKLGDDDTISLHQTNLNQLLEDVINSQLDPEKHEVIFLPADHLPKVLVNKTEITQAFRNLLKNALTYTPADGKIIIRTEQVNDGIQVSVQDTGIGIAEDDLPHIFDLFYRVDTARGNIGESGLGLAIVKQIMARHGGHIEVTSTLGEGSEFRMWMPIMQEASTN